LRRAPDHQTEGQQMSVEQVIEVIREEWAKHTLTFITVRK
jgi:hypothetical protein